MTAIIVGILVITILILTYLAYAKPEMYKTMSKWLFGMTIIVPLIIAVWDSSAQMTFDSIRDLIPAEKLNEAELKAEQFQINVLVLLLCTIGFQTYFAFLLNFRSIFKKE